MDRRASLTAEQVAALNLATISFDRPAAYYDPAGFKSAQSKSDILMSTFVATPLLLVLDKKIRRDWADMLGDASCCARCGQHDFLLYYFGSS